MNYLDFIEANEGFQYSVNIQYDLYNNNKIKGYIPTPKSVEILKQYLISTKLKDSNKATVLVGPYGKGKSHLLLVLLNILSGMQGEQICKLAERVSNIDPGCADLIKEQSQRKYMPVIINSNSMDLKQSFLLGLKQSLSNAKINNILPKTYYEAAIDVINNWKNYSETYSHVEELIEQECGVSIDQFINSLKGYSQKSYDVFKKIFFTITSGVEYNPLINSDVVKLYEEVNHILHEKYKYDGIVIIFDEFSKFIEGSSSYNNVNDLKILQDIAELSNRSQNPQLHLICVTHKTINEYISEIPKNKIDAWRTIEGRFKEIYFTSSAQQNYELISNAIIKNEEIFRQYWLQNKSKYEKYYDGAFHLFKENYKEGIYIEQILKGCFPLSPYSVFALPRVSEKVAQNERTLFTFLCKDDSSSLLEVIKSDDFKNRLVTIDMLYDYFEQLFKKELYNKFINNIWIKTDAALRCCDNDIEQRIVKALSIINIINDYKTLSPTVETIAHCIGIRKEECTSIINRLTVKSILMVKKSTCLVDFIPISGVDVEGRIESTIQTFKNKLLIEEELGNLLKLKYVVPREYNDEYKINRYFNKVIITTEKLLSYNSKTAGNELLQRYGGDGLFLYVLIENDDERNIVEKWIEGLDDQRICLVIPDSNLSLYDPIKRYAAIKKLMLDDDLLKEDTAVISQLSILLDDVQSYIYMIFNEKFSTNQGELVLYHENDKVNYYRGLKLSTIASKLCFHIYNNTPIINNELINKNRISSPMLKGRNFLINMILSGEYLEYDYNGTSVEKTLYRTTLLNKGLVGDENISRDIEYTLKVIKENLNLAEKEEICFGTIYKKLMGDKLGLGLRKGIIPIYLAYIMKEHIDDLIITVGGIRRTEIELSCDTLNNINNNPDEYYIKVEKGTKDKEEYIKLLDLLFSEFKVQSLNESRYSKTVKQIQKWMNSLSKYAKTHKVNIKINKNLDKEILNFRKSIMKYDLNYREFLFEDIPNIFNEKSLLDCYEKITSIKQYEEKCDELLLLAVKEKTITVLSKGYSGTLSSAVRVWIMSLEDEKLNHLYDSITNEAIALLISGINNDELLVSKLSYILTGLALEDWNDYTINDYEKELIRVKNTIESYDVVCDDSDCNKFKIILEGNNQIVDKSFDMVDITPLGQMLLSNLEESFDEFGDSIDDNEKRNILIKILEKFI